MRRFLVNVIAEAIEKVLLRAELKINPLHFGRLIAYFELNHEREQKNEKPS